jgi:hypothetical protein
MPFITECDAQVCRIPWKLIGGEIFARLFVSRIGSAW